MNSMSQETQPPPVSALGSKEIPWTDDRIRWEDVSDDDPPKGEDEEEAAALRDPFKSEDSTEIFARRFAFHKKDEENEIILQVQLQGYQADADEIWKSTGLTLWRASDYLCEYLVEQPQLLLGRSKCNCNRNTHILELGAGLGLVGIVAHRILVAAAAWTNENGSSVHRSQVLLTDGDTDTLVQLRANIERNRPVESSSAHDDDDNNNNHHHRLECRQLLWGRETALQIQRELQQQQQPDSDTMTVHRGTFDMILASDIVYAASIVEPLWETVQVLLSKPPQPSAAAANESPPPCFVLAFAKRRVPVTIDTVLEAAVQHGFTYQLVKEDPTGIWIYVFEWGEAVSEQRQHDKVNSTTRNDKTAGKFELFF